MAYNRFVDASRIIKWVIVAAVLFAGWKYVLPRLRGSGGSASSPTADSGGAPCVAAAEHASDSWGSGIGRFANPPYDLEAWSAFQRDVNGNISTAQSICTSPAASNEKARDAMNDLHSLVGQLDASIRGGAPPGSEIVQRQGAIDDLINSARELAQNGK